MPQPTAGQDQGARLHGGRPQRGEGAQDHEGSLLRDPDEPRVSGAVMTG